MPRLWIAAMLAAGALAASAPATAQRGGASISLYSSTSFNGTRLTLRNSTSSLNRYGFNNRTRSVRVRGTWTLCDQPNYRGRCVTISSNRSSLNGMGLSGRVSSVRFRGW